MAYVDIMRMDYVCFWHLDSFVLRLITRNNADNISCPYSTHTYLPQPPAPLIPHTQASSLNSYWRRHGNGPDGQHIPASVLCQRLKVAVGLSADAAEELVKLMPSNKDDRVHYPVRESGCDSALGEGRMKCGV